MVEVSKEEFNSRLNEDEYSSTESYRNGDVTYHYTAYLGGPLVGWKTIVQNKDVRPDRYVLC